MARASCTPLKDHLPFHLATLWPEESWGLQLNNTCLFKVNTHLFLNNPTVDGRNPAPRKKPWFLMIPLQIPPNLMVSHGFKVARNGFRPSKHRSEQTLVERRLSCWKGLCLLVMLVGGSCCFMLDNPSV